MSDTLQLIATQLGSNGLLVGSAIGDRYRCDWTGKLATSPIAVARPRSTADIAAVLRLCHAGGQPVVVQGGMTGLAGGATPRAGELAISLERMTGIEELDVDSGTLAVKAGTPLATVQSAAAEAGLSFALDLGARGSCTIGGNIATNAGGNHVIRYGMMRNLVLGLEAVLADGTILTSMNAMLKNNAGYDVKQLFVGTEGTLGIVTRAVLRLQPRPAGHLTVLAAVDRFSDLVGLLRRVRTEFGGLCAFEAMWSDYFEIALAREGLVRPFGSTHSHYALIDLESAEESHELARLQEVVGAALQSGRVADAIVAGSIDEAARLWRIRDVAGELIHRLDPAIAYDVSMPISRMEAYVADVTQRCLRSGAAREFGTFGHLGDGNLHFLVALRVRDDLEQIDEIVYGALRGFGSVSAEHGIGTLKRAWLGASRNPAEIALMRTLKTALDPRGILNPGRVFETAGRPP